MGKETEILSILKSMSEQMVVMDERLSSVEDRLVGFDKTLEMLDKISIISDNRLTRVEKAVTQIPTVVHMVSELHNRIIEKPDVFIIKK